eukprot:TRINITY_DN730_c0_g2_i1.p2 TRINITY_DN730_c0_g2~~TRINITY_DN730_c0_g2_i1.p2  ORF type:complete len:254 (-),score=53.99 TRINITY_DN730_c0_g2_i1:410-1171(-)
MGKSLDHAISLYMDGIRDGNYEQAIAKHTGSRYTQHSTGVATGQQGFKDFFKGFIARNPQRKMRVLRTVEDGRYVFVNVYQHVSGGKWVTMDLFDTQRDGRIVEHWDVIEAYSESTVSGVDMVEGAGEATDLEHTDQNKEIVRDFVKMVLCDGELHRLTQFVAHDLIQHTPDLHAGREGLRKGLEDGTAHKVEFLLHLIGQGNMVVTYCKTLKKEKEHATFTVYRLEAGLIAEQWSVSEPILPREQWGNCGKF